MTELDFLIFSDNLFAISQLIDWLLENEFE